MIIRLSEYIIHSGVDMTSEPAMDGNFSSKTVIENEI